MTISSKEIEGVLKLDSSERYTHFIKRVADSETVWGLYNDGWAMGATSDGKPVFPVWPAEEYAALAAQNNWAGYEPESIELDDVIDELCPQLEKDGLVFGVFYTPQGAGAVMREPRLLAADLRKELELYE